MLSLVIVSPVITVFHSCVYCTTFWPSNPLAGLGRNWNCYLLTILGRNVVRKTTKKTTKMRTKVRNKINMDLVCFFFNFFFPPSYQFVIYLCINCIMFFFFFHATRMIDIRIKHMHTNACMCVGGCFEYKQKREKKHQQVACICHHKQNLVEKERWPMHKHCDTNANELPRVN